jgi:type IV pilus assembly protein PilQ
VRETRGGGRWWAAPVGLCLLLGGCTAHRNDNSDLTTLLDAYRAENEKLEQGREELRQRGVRLLRVHSGSLRAARVSVDLVAARLDVVVEEILKRADLPFVSNLPRLLGTVTARFEDLPVVEALCTLLRSRGFTARVMDDVLILEAGVDEAWRDDEPPPPRSDETITVEFPLAHVTSEHAGEMLHELFPVNEDTGAREVLFAARRESNSMFLSGQRASVDRATEILTQIDKDAGHVLIEALVVEFNTQSFIEMGSRIASGSSGRVADFFFDVANAVGDTISFSRVADPASSTTFSAVLNLLLQTEQARILSRPYVATLSGSPARLEIAEDRFVVVESPGNIDVTLESITSGVTLELLPILTAEGTIFLQMAVDESRFVPTLENVEQRRARNNVSTFAQVQSGETVIVGGLMLKTRSSGQAGIPWLRRIPPFSYFFGHEDRSQQESQVMIFVTPRLWEPGLDMPLRATEPFLLYPGEQAEVGGKGKKGGG